jgi:putative DNA primase/helicase
MSKVVPLKSGADPAMLASTNDSDAASPAPGKTGGKRKKAPPDWMTDVIRLADHFALIYGTDTVFDAEDRMLVRVAPLRLAYGAAVKEWLKSPNRKTIRQEDVVFDPRHPERPWNLFGGLPGIPKLGKCNLILDLVDYLTGGNVAMREWVLKWIAYPLQHVGAKMATSIVMRGPQGGGKNMLWECVRDIYGVYGTLITQSELESQYNDWMSAKLFVIGNEVLSRREKWQLGGKLKNLVTEAQVPIQAKYMPSRLESNCCNLVFLSNDLLPVPLEESNRRYLVIDAPHPHPDGKLFYTAVAEQIASGGREAFHDYLLTLPLGDFGPHTKPLPTEAFQEALELSLSPSELFVRRWKAGDLPILQSGDQAVPVWGGAIDDLYEIFRTWCTREGERHVDTQTRFARTLMVAGMRKRRMRLTLTISARQYRVYWWDERVPDGCEDVERWLSAECGYANGCVVQTSRP